MRGNILHKHQHQVRQNIVRKIKAPKPTPTQYCTFRSGIAVGDSKYLEILTNLCMILYEENSDGMVLESVFVLYLLDTDLSSLSAGWQVSENMTWTQLAGVDPQLPHSFNPILADNLLFPEDILAARCVMVPDQSK